MNLKKKFEEEVELNDDLFKGNSNYQRIRGNDWCQNIEQMEALCRKLLLGLDLVLNPGGDLQGSTGYSSALEDKLCERSRGDIDENWFRTFGEWIGLGVTASRNINKKAKDAKNKLTQAQQSGASSITI